MDEEKIVQFHQKMTEERINNNSVHESELKQAYVEILQGMASNYAEYRRYVPKLLSSLEFNNLHSVSYSVTLFFSLFDGLTKFGQFAHFDTHIVQHEANVNTLEKIKPLFEAARQKIKQQRISEDNFDISSLSNDDKKEIASLIIDNLHTDSEQLNWDKDTVDVTLMYFGLLRQILASLGNAELFYHAVGILFDRLTSSEYYQAGRDLAEEIIISSYKDQVPELGYFNAFRLYSNIGSIHASLLYANLSIISAFQKKPPHSEKYVKEIIWQGIKCFRNVRLFPWAIQIYKCRPLGLNFLDYERRSLDHTFFTSLLAMMDTSLPSLLLEYLSKEREAVINGGVSEAMPWLLTLYNIKRHYPAADFSPTALGFFLNVFEAIVPGDTIKKYKDIINADSSDLKRHLKESLLKLNETRNRSDFVYDNESAIRISSRLVDFSTEHKDPSSFLLSMVLKSDYSMLFQSKESKDIAPLMLPDANVDKLETLYEDIDAFLLKIPIDPKTSVIWIAISERDLYELQLYNKEFSFFQLTTWDRDVYEELINSDYFVDLYFSDCTSDNNGVRLVSPEEFEQQETLISKTLSFAKLSVNEKSAGVCLVKDMELSKFPHNLFINQDGKFIAKSVPVTNILSTEWLLQANFPKSANSTCTKAIWLPIEGQDFTLNYLYSSIEDVLQEYSFEVHKGLTPSKPLSSDINIVCSHGAKDISEVQIVYQESDVSNNLNSVVGPGRILIFFVCYSGSMKTEFFRNNVTSLVKRFIAQGYSAIIAPFWALEVTIPRYWLPEFLKSFNSGDPISKAVFIANNKVREKYATPSAWACLHLYGNPNLRNEAQEITQP